MVAITKEVPSGLRFAAVPDIMPIYEAEALARSLAQYTPTDEAEKLLAQQAAQARAGQDFTDALNIYDLRTWKPQLTWNDLTPARRLRVPIGKTPSGVVAELDLKEAAEAGMGPHGLMVGMTGSGKSEHLKSLVLALCATHSPVQLRLLLGDFKGESGLGDLERLPHVEGLVSNLEGSRHKLVRFQSVLRGELGRRQELLKRAGFKGVREYEAAREAGRTDLEPIGTLVLVLDEFAQMLVLLPEMGGTMDEVARLGRSLWIHILNASQRVEGGKAQGMQSQQQFAIGMKVRNAGESRAAIGSTRAYDEFKSKDAPPGSAFLVVDDEHTRYRAFYASGPYTPPKINAAERDRAEGQYLPVAKFTSAMSALPDTIGVEDEDDLDELDVSDVGVQTVDQLMVDRICEDARTLPRGHRMWRPDLEETEKLPIDEIVTEYWQRERWQDFTEDSGLVAPFGREDDWYWHSQDVVAVDLGSTHGGVAGAPQAGKSTAVRTLIMSLAMANSPARVQFYGIDFGGGKLASLASLPHVSGIAATGDDERIGRVVSEVERILRNRKREWGRFGEAGMDLARYRAAKFGPNKMPVPDDQHGDVFLVVDNISKLKAEMVEIHDRIIALADGALSFGVHVIIANDSWLTIKNADKLLAKVELKLGDKSDSKMDRQLAEDVPSKQKGRGLVESGNHMLVAVPYLSEFIELSDTDATEATAKAVAAEWAARGFGPAPRLRQLPAEVDFDDLPPMPTTAPRHALPVGIGEREMSTVWLDLEQNPHAWCTGTARSGRSAFLQTVCAAIQQRYTPEEAQIIAFDPSEDLADAISDRYRVVYENQHQRIGQASAELAQLLERRKPPANLPPRELRQWRATVVRPKWFVIIDDLNLLTPANTYGSLTLPLVGPAESAKNLDLHIIAAITIDNWYAKGQSHKLLSAMTTAGSSVVVLDGNPAEKIIDQVRPASRAPGRAELYERKGGGQLMQIALPPLIVDEPSSVS